MAPVNKRIVLLVGAISITAALLWLLLVPRKSIATIIGGRLFEAYTTLGNPTAIELYSRQGDVILMVMDQQTRDELSKSCKEIRGSSDFFWIIAIRPDPASIGCRELPLVASIPNRVSARPIYLQWREGTNRLMGELKSETVNAGRRRIVVEVNARQLCLDAEPDANVTVEFEAFYKD